MKLIHFPLVLIAIAILWMVVAFRVYSGYRDFVRRTCKTNGQEGPAKSPHPEFAELKNRSVQNLIDMMSGRVPQDLVN